MKRFLIVVAGTMVVGGLLFPREAPAQGPTVPPHSSAFGKTLPEWIATYWTGYYNQFFNGVPWNNQVGHVLLLPVPTVPDSAEYIGGGGIYNDLAIFKGELRVTLKPGTPFVLPVSGWVLETYRPMPPGAGYPDDKPIPKSILTEGPNIVTITQIDKKTGKPGKKEVVMDSTTGDVSPFYVESPMSVKYNTPTSYGSTGMIYMQSLGFAHTPLPPGEYVMDLISTLNIPPNPDYMLLEVYPDGLGVQYINRWYITVTPK